MSKLPVLSGEKCIKALGKAGFYLKRQEGSHVTLRRDEPFCQSACLFIGNWTEERCELLFVRRGCQ
jgi:hypothetical protein